MISKVKGIIVKKLYWSCGNPKHLHKTMEIAIKCAEKTAKHIVIKDVNDNTKRGITALRMAINGSTWDSVGSAIGGVTGTRARQLACQFMRKSISPKRFSGIMPKHDYYYIKEVREHADFWFERIDCMEKEFGISDFGN